MTTSKAKTGRPSVITPATIAKLTEALKLDLTVEKACDYAGISKDTYYRHLKDKDFSDEMRIAQMNLEIEAKKSITKGIKEDSNLALKVLERRCKKQYSPRFVHSVDGDLTITQMIMECSKNRVIADWDDAGLNEKVKNNTQEATQNWDDE